MALHRLHFVFAFTIPKTNKFGPASNQPSGWKVHAVPAHPSAIAHLSTPMRSSRSIRAMALAILLMNQVGHAFVLLPFGALMKYYILAQSHFPKEFVYVSKMVRMMATVVHTMAIKLVAYPMRDH